MIIPGALTRTTFVTGVAGLTSPGDAIDVVGEVATIMHMMAEAPWDAVKHLASDKYLDKDFKKALGMFDASNDGDPGKDDMIIQADISFPQ